MRALIAVIVLAWISGASAAELTGRVVGISDGDTITVLDTNRTQHKIRLAGIDAPEGKQPFGTRSKQNLSAMVFPKDVHLECHKTDRYGRSVCKVWVQPASCDNCGKTLDVGLAQIVAGMAWWYRDYAHEQSAEDRGRSESSENDARLRRFGLWDDARPVPPWEWRRNDRH